MQTKIFLSIKLIYIRKNSLNCFILIAFEFSFANTVRNGKEMAVVVD